MYFSLPFHVSVNQRKIKSSSKNENHMSLEHTLLFDQWKTFPENYKPIRILFTKLPTKIVFRDISPNSWKLKGGILPSLTTEVF